MNRWGIVRWLQAACLALGLTGAQQAAAQGEPLFRPVGDDVVAGSAVQAGRLQSLRDAPETGAVDVVGVNLRALEAAQTVIPLPGAADLGVTRRNIQSRGPADFTWVGDLPAGAGQAIMVVKNGEVTGLIQNGDARYSVTPLGGGLHAIAEITGAFPPDHPGAPLPTPGQRSSLGAPDAPLAADPIQVDILIPYTAAARAANPNIASLAQLAVDASNVAYTNSNANVTLRLVGTMEVAYTESSFNQALVDLQAGTGVMAQVQARRQSLGADLVSLFVNLSDACGLGYVQSDASYAFSVVYWSCAAGNYSLAHELGHNFGARHDPAVDPSNTPYPYGHGFVNGNWRTIMAYPNSCGGCPRIQRFSNPSVLYQGSPTGTAATHDVARVHRERVGTVAAFRIPVNTNAGDLLIDFGSAGLWQFMNNSRWLKIHSATTQVITVGDLDGSGREEAIAGFASLGLWARYNNTAWVKLHNGVPARMTTGDLDGNGQDDLVVDFGSGGLWVRMNNASWVNRNSTTSQWIGTGDLDANTRDDLVADFGAAGLWAWMNNTSWIKLHNGSPTRLAIGDLDGNGLDEVVADFAPGIWARSANGAWSRLNTGRSEALATGDLDGNRRYELIADFGSGGLWTLFYPSTWGKLNAGSPTDVVAGDLNGNAKEEVIAAFGSAGLYVRYDVGSWARINTTPEKAMAPGRLD